jgi:serine/threonine protein phosphatase PrpC
MPSHGSNRRIFTGTLDHILQVACIERTPKDEVLVLATDGLWDVFSCKVCVPEAWRQRGILKISSDL